MLFFFNFYNFLDVDFLYGLGGLDEFNIFVDFFGVGFDIDDNNGFFGGKDDLFNGFDLEVDNGHFLGLRVEADFNFLGLCFILGFDGVDYVATLDG